MSAAVSHHGSCTLCQAIQRTASMAQQIIARAIHRRNATVSCKAKATFRQSNQRHGSCTKRSFGRYCQNIVVTGSIIKEAAAPQPASVRHGACESSSHRRETNAATVNRTASDAPTSDTASLKRLCSLLLIRVKKKLSCGRKPGASTWAIFTHFSSKAAG